MKRLLIALTIGLIVALLDTAPMWLRKAPLMKIATPFFHWIMVAVLAAYSSIPLPMWATGLLISVTTTIPLLFVLAQTRPSAVPVVAGLSVVMGLLTGLALQLALTDWATN